MWLYSQSTCSCWVPVLCFNFSNILSWHFITILLSSVQCSGFKSCSSIPQCSQDCWFSHPPASHSQLIVITSRYKSHPNWIKTSRLWAPKDRDPRLSLQPRSSFSSLSRISSKLINWVGWFSYRPFKKTNHSNVKSSNVRVWDIFP